MAMYTYRRERHKKTVWQRLSARVLPAREGAGLFFFAPCLKLLAVTMLFTCFFGGPAFAMGSAGRTPPGQGTDTAPTPLVVPSLNVSIKDILTGSVKLDSAEVLVKGIFKGWKGDCPSSSAITRSDWVLEDETGCIYVTGRIPTALSPTRPMGEHVLVKGRVIVTKTGKPVIKASQITLLSK
jgi:hypothetical protein